MVESEIVEWRVAVGSHISIDEPLVDVMTDKAVIEITAPVSGKVASLAGKPGDIVAVGAALVIFEVDTEPDQVVAPAPAGQAQAQEKVLTSPSVRYRAREHHIDLDRVPASGPNNRITREDLDRYIAGLASTETPQAAPPTNDIIEVPIIGIRRKIAEKMLESKRNIPHFGYVEEIDVTALESLRQHLNHNKEAQQTKLSYLPFFICALTRVLAGFPQCNARYDEESGVLHQYANMHVGIATQTDSGLKVPVVKDANTLDIWACAAEIQRLAEAAKDNTASRNELSGSTITISSLGALGGITVIPIINSPETAIIGVNKMEDRPVVRDNQVVIRKMMNLSCCFDHRFVDGQDAALMIQSLKRFLEQPAAMFV